MYCKHCGNQIPDGSIYCDKCGKQVNDVVIPVDAKVIIKKGAISNTKKQESKWRPASKMKWRKPVLPLIIKILLIALFGLMMVFGVVGLFIDTEETFLYVAMIVLGILIVLITIFKFKTRRFPCADDPLPRDLADEMESYVWLGIGQHKYVFFKKDNKYGIIDAGQYKIAYPAKYDEIEWRIPNKSFDVMENGNKSTITID
jgi:hypothetical protein